MYIIFMSYFTILYALTDLLVLLFVINPMLKNHNHPSNGWFALRL